VQALPVTTVCVLRVLDGDDAGKTAEIGREAVTVGTKEGCALRLSDTAVSGRHFTVEVGPEGLVVRDLDSKNGTFYLGTRIERAVVQVGAVLRVGRTRIVLASRQPAAGPGFSSRSSYGAIVGASPAMRRLFAALEQLEAHEYTTLILGETGVGKELVAQEIHRHSPRAARPFEVCDCASLTPTLIESELFGHVRGAFTGAHATTHGVFERAHGGTIFLDEIGELPLELQPRLLRVLESHTVRRVGAGQTQAVDVRVVAATNRDLAEQVQRGAFRQDLFFRLNLATISVPPLRDRREDIPLLIAHFLAAMGQADVQLSPATLELFTTGYDWPGNVRELHHAVARAQTLGAVPPELQSAAAPAADAPDEADVADAAFDVAGRFKDEKRRIVAAFERDYLAAKLQQASNNISEAARAAGMDRNQFKRLLRKNGLLP
jgi:transcriptional regulator with GAF, ATPase, and Fis domain